MVKPIDPRKFAGIDPAGWYGSGEVAALFGKVPATVARWCRVGLLASVPDPGAPHVYRISGESVLALAAPLMRAAYPAATETKRQLERRAKAAADEIERLVRAGRRG